MFTDSKLQLSQFFQLRQELGMPINAIIGYSKIIIEELEGIGKDAAYLPEIEQIRQYGENLLASLNNCLDPTAMPTNQLDLREVIQNPQLLDELEKPTQLVIDGSERLISLVEDDFIDEIGKINSAANKLLGKINTLVEPTPEIELLEDTAPDLDKTTPLVDEIILDSERQKSAVTDHSILVVDDSMTNREVLSKQVEAEGYQVATAKDGTQAIQMIQTGVYDLILLDIIMPKLDGYEVLQWIRNSPWKNIPTIMISALEQIDSIVRCIEMGAADYLTKPFNPTLLKARLAACLEQKRLRDLESSYIAQLAQANQKIGHLNNCLQVENTRLTSELEVTQKLQQMLLPKEKELAKIEDLEIAGFCEAATEVGGDYYDVVQHQGRIIIGIGDVSGHGLESGVLMLMVQTAIRTLIENNETNLKCLFEVLNRTIYKNVQRLDSDKNISLSIVDYQEGILNISGQHEEILIVRTGGKIERIDTIDLGFPLGLTESIEDFVLETKIPLAKDEVVVLYTDGITEAENTEGEHYGLEKLCTVVKHNWQESALDLRQIVIQDLRSHIGIEQVYDDITLVVLKRR